MASMAEFLGRQREAAASLLTAYVELTGSRRELIQAQLGAIKRVNATAGGRQARELAAAAAVGPAFEVGEAQVREKARMIHEVAASMSDNWQEHEHLWDDLGLEDAAMVVDALASWTEAGQAAANAEHGDRELLRSLREFASLGRAAAAASEGLISAQGAIISASGEVHALADEYVEVLDDVRRRIDGG
jgi:hypothetical protein